MEGIIKVTPEELISTAEEFNSVSTQVQNLTRNMLDTVNALNSTWQGDAAEKYRGRFKELEDDMNKMHSMINEHVTDLRDMAQRYQQTEQKNAEIGGALSGDAIK